MRVYRYVLNLYKAVALLASRIGVYGSRQAGVTFLWFKCKWGRRENLLLPPVELKRAGHWGSTSRRRQVCGAPGTCPRPPPALPFPSLDFRASGWEDAAAQEQSPVHRLTVPLAPARALRPPGQTEARPFPPPRPPPAAEPALPLSRV